MNHLLLITLLLPGSANAAGVRCTSNCVLIEPYRNRPILLGKVSNDADLARDQLFDLIQTECASRAQKLGWHGRTILVRQLWYRKDQSVWLDFDRAESACKTDSTIPAGTAPKYPGSLPFHG